MIDGSWLLLLPVVAVAAFALGIGVGLVTRKRKAINVIASVSGSMYPTSAPAALEMIKRLSNP